VAVRKVEEAAGKSEASQARAKAEERAAEDKALSVVLQEGQSNSSAEYLSSFDLARFLRVALAPSLPRAVRVFLSRCATLLFRRAVLAAFLIFRLATARCFLVVTFFRSMGFPVPQSGDVIALVSHLL